MEIDDFKKLVQYLTEENITLDEPHVSMRCVENNITPDEIKKIVLSENTQLIRIVEDGPKVFKLYYRLSKKQELKIVIDLFTYKKINVRTVKRLVQKFRLGAIVRRFK